MCVCVCVCVCARACVCVCVYLKTEVCESIIFPCPDWRRLPEFPTTAQLWQRKGRGWRSRDGGRITWKSWDITSSSFCLSPLLCKACAMKSYISNINDVIQYISVILHHISNINDVIHISYITSYIKYQWCHTYQLYYIYQTYIKTYISMN